MVSWDTDGLSRQWTDGDLFRCTAVISWSIAWILWNETQDQFTSAQKFSAQLVGQQRQCYLRWYLHWGLPRTGVWSRATLSLIFLLWNRHEIVYVKALLVKPEVLSVGRLLLLFAQSECSCLFTAHKPGRLLEPSVGIVGEEHQENTDFQSHPRLTESDSLWADLEVYVSSR